MHLRMIFLALSTPYNLISLLTTLFACLCTALFFKAPRPLNLLAAALALLSSNSEFAILFSVLLPLLSARYLAPLRIDGAFLKRIYPSFWASNRCLFLEQMFFVFSPCYCRRLLGLSFFSSKCFFFFFLYLGLELRCRVLLIDVRAIFGLNEQVVASCLHLFAFSQKKR